MESESPGCAELAIERLSDECVGELVATGPWGIHEQPCLEGFVDVDRILASKDRSEAGATAPAQGLYLLSVLYDEPVFVGRPRGPRGVAGPFQY